MSQCECATTSTPPRQSTLLLSPLNTLVYFSSVCWLFLFCRFFVFSFCIYFVKFVLFVVGIFVFYLFVGERLLFCSFWCLFCVFCFLWFSFLVFWHFCQGELLVL